MPRRLLQFIPDLYTVDLHLLLLCQPSYQPIKLTPANVCLSNWIGGCRWWWLPGGSLVNCFQHTWLLRSIIWYLHCLSAPTEWHPITCCKCLEHAGTQPSTQYLPVWESSSPFVSFYSEMFCRDSKNYRFRLKKSEKNSFRVNQRTWLHNATYFTTF
jgi:hypothetical protein